MRKRIALRAFVIRVTDDVATLYSALPPGVRSAHRTMHLSTLMLLAMFAVPVVAQTNAAIPDFGSTLFEVPSRQYLFGDWGGKRSKLAEKGITFDFFYISDLEASPSGGLKQTQAGWERVRGTLDINFDRAHRLARSQFSHYWALAVRSQLGSKDRNARQSE
jgi:hypothetical protein